MSAFVPLNPRPMLQALVDQEVIVRLKWNTYEYKGKLVSVDSYMNILLSNTEEFLDGKSSGSLGQVFIRCNNVLWISAANAAKVYDANASGIRFHRAQGAKVKTEVKTEDKDKD